MSKETFLEELDKYGISNSIVCFDDNVTDDVFCVINNYGTINVFYREKGAAFNLHSFNSMEKALEYLLKEILQISGISLKM